MLPNLLPTPQSRRVQRLPGRRSAGAHGRRVNVSPKSPLACCRGQSTRANARCWLRISLRADEEFAAARLRSRYGSSKGASIAQAEFPANGDGLPGSAAELDGNEREHEAGLARMRAPIGLGRVRVLWRLARAFSTPPGTPRSHSCRRSKLLPVPVGIAPQSDVRLG